MPLAVALTAATASDSGSESQTRPGGGGLGARRGRLPVGPAAVPYDSETPAVRLGKHWQRAASGSLTGTASTYYYYWDSLAR